MPLCEWRSNPPAFPKSSSKICEILPDLCKATDKKWFVDEHMIEPAKLGFFRKKEPVYVYDLLLEIYEGFEYQIINGVSTEREVLAFAYGAIGTKLNKVT